MAPITQDSIRNNLLRSLPVEAFASLLPAMEPIALPLKFCLVESNVANSHVIFIESGLCSLVAGSADGEDIEVGHIGYEGMSGGHSLLRVDRTPNRTFMQVAGHGIRVPVPDLMRLLDDPAVNALFMNYVHCCEVQLAHSALANARYTMHERLARRLLMCHDRITGDDLPITHEFLSLMLGVRRSGVTNELHVIEGVKAIRATRGNIRITDRARLESIAGACYGLPEQEYKRLIGFRPPASS
ncbi:Crp/Fnr family transcriptional regulator [Rhizobium sp. CC-YZS058]|uniref:Crp/Fnr family transcriptional regulator n=1 Tax=Rhizobium sp. CC-YZS058 TaxID=3042153 RepID=UPI002B053AB4|nr:Crp/Fnr family transcriptional regulator [Rhizobium sp. CC-YZS058]MEA3534548.1 Crp/Fnr family transcriptional regulator [Rhizobium sp. CC-YZS058]